MDVIQCEVCVQHSDSSSANVFRLEVKLMCSVVPPGLFTPEEYFYTVQQPPSLL